MIPLHQRDLLVGKPGYSLKILLSTHGFDPHIGGLEAVACMLAREFVRVGHEVVVVTHTPAGQEVAAFPFRVVRRPSLSALLRLFRWADVVFHNHVSLRMAWPLCFIRRPWVVVHHGWVPRGFGVTGLKGSVKHLILHRATGIAVSKAVAEDFKTPAQVIHNPYDAETFRLLLGIARDRDLIFVGRFVSDKGLPVLLDALDALGRRGLRPSLTVVGYGPEEAVWRRRTWELGLAAQVHFAGVKVGAALGEALNAHRVLVVPSLWNEPFGIVALEGMACGCVVVGSQGGGLGEAIGPGGLTFPNGDVAVLADRLEQVLTDADLVTRFRAALPEYLARHRPSEVAAGYLEVFERVVHENH
jgi:glycosyltransferase involved in cell wall biosynthesis